MTVISSNFPDAGITSTALLLVALLLLSLEPVGRDGHRDKSVFRNAYISSCLFYTEASAIFSKAAYTPYRILALVSKCFIFGCFFRNS